MCRRQIAWMAVETMIARQLTYFVAREKDCDRRCDIEVGMAKLLAARVAWSNADPSPGGLRGLIEGRN